MAAQKAADRTLWQKGKEYVDVYKRQMCECLKYEDKMERELFKEGLLAVSYTHLQILQRWKIRNL